jgi:hypothetical protein
MKKLFVTLTIGLSCIAEAMDLQDRSIEDECFIYTVVNNEEVSCCPRFRRSENGSIQRLFEKKAHPRSRVIIEGKFFDVTSIVDVGWEFEDVEPDTVLTEICISPNVRHIGVACFAGCVNLREVPIDMGSQLILIDDYAFYRCHSLKSILLPRNTFITPYSFPAWVDVKWA